MRSQVTTMRWTEAEMKRWARAHRAMLEVTTVGHPHFDGTTTMPESGRTVYLFNARCRGCDYVHCPMTFNSHLGWWSCPVGDCNLYQEDHYESRQDDIFRQIFT